MVCFIDLLMLHVALKNYAEYIRFCFHTVPLSPTDVSVQPLYRVDGSIQYVDVGFNGVVSFKKLMHMFPVLTYVTRDLEITYPVRLFKSCYASLDLVLVGVASFYRILIVQRRARASQLHKRSAHLKVNTCSFQSCN